MRKTRTCPAGATRAIFVEGGDDERMVRHLLPDVPVFVQTLDGCDSLQMERRARAAQNDPGWPLITSVGVVLDAALDPGGGVARAGVIFQKLGLAAPATGGSVAVDANGTKTGVFIVPDDQNCGGSDTLLLKTMHASTRACADAFLQCMNASGNPEQLDKARIWAIAAGKGRLRPDKLWGQVDPTHPALADLRAWLASL